MKMKPIRLIAILALLSCYQICFSQEPVSSWKAKWIKIGYTEDTISRPSQYFGKDFNSGKKIKSAKLYITSHGFYEASINGQKVGDAFFTPGWTQYTKRLQYQSYDVAPLLKKGDNRLTVVLGDGWYRGYVGYEGMKNIYGTDLALLAQLDITYADGKTSLITSDESWKCGEGSIRSNSINHGETIDANKDINLSQQVAVVDYGFKNLEPSTAVPVRRHESFKPLKVITTPKGEKVIDFGQNLVGWVKVNLHGNKGDTVRIQHAEVLDKAGNFYTENLRNAKTTATYILSGKPSESFEPHFTYFGFRYVKISGLKGEINPADFSAEALYADMRPTGSFECSNLLLNQLQKNIIWGQKGNFLVIPTDCPQRDERLGWVGDAQVFARTSAFNFDVNPFFSHWMKDVAIDQRKDGAVAFVSPNVLDDTAVGSSGWSDVATIIPWTMYEVYGNRTILSDQYASMKGWVDYMASHMDKKDLFHYGFHFGDWLSYRSPDDDGSDAITDKYEIAQCFFAYSTQLLINAAKVLGKSEDAENYNKLLSRIKAAYVKEYMTSSGRLMSNTQTAYVLALQFDMLPEQNRADAAKYLVEDIRRYKDHLTTGFLGTPYLCHVLSRFGYSDVAYTLLTQDTYPSWLYPVKMGATTIWERWDGIKTDGTFQTTRMNSFNHYAYGAIGDWMYQNVLGIQIGEAGYKKIIIKPIIGRGLSWAKGSYLSANGKISSSWKLTGNIVDLEVEIPSGTSAEVWVPGASKPVKVGPGRHQFKGSYNNPEHQKVSLYENNKIPFAKEISELPTLTVFPSTKPSKKNVAVIVCSGGSYFGRANSVEGTPACQKLAAEGITAFLLDYRVPNSERMNRKEIVPLTDAQRAIQYIREHAGEYDIDPNKIGIMGFSAGGHLVSTVGTHFKNTELANPLNTSLRPDFMVLVYPVISFSNALTHIDSRNNLIGPDLSAEKIREFSNELHVDKQTVPAYIVHGKNDSAVKFANSEVFYDALKKGGVKTEFLKYEKGEHGFGAFNKDSNIRWMDECIKWIKANKWK
ncbi:family 78 glycoside hydrolase catalytic domain [Pedobacter paludis]|uniref:alpha-L-rhamnosidase n=1 Tax=Pedobacter paludis TaxID=2203212 RepID=A0A317F0I7_9SPHI|nr:family 78 glycoside hydrolase catalytic domain [Pedobacter paludis]PWS32644.1 alpha-L-rhamnosidase [Pedobacter paludis]